MPRLAIVIPALGSIEALECTLVSVLENRPDDCDILVVLNQPYEDPYALQGEVSFLEAAAGASLTACVALGVSETNAPVVHLLESGCEVSEGWTAHALRHFDDPSVAAVAPLLLDKNKRAAVLATGVRYAAGGARRTAKARLTTVEKHGATRQLGPSSQAAFYRRSVFQLEHVGYLPAASDFTADVELALVLRHAGLVSVSEPRSRVYATRQAPPKRGFRHARHAERLFWRNAPLVGWSRALFGHALVVAIETIASFPRPAMLTQLAGRAFACLEVTSYRRHHQWLDEIADSSAAGAVAGQLHANEAREPSKPSTRRKAG